MDQKIIFAIISLCICCISLGIGLGAFTLFFNNKRPQGQIETPQKQIETPQKQIETPQKQIETPQKQTETSQIQTETSETSKFEDIGIIQNAMGSCIQFVDGDLVEGQFCKKDSLPIWYYNKSTKQLKMGEICMALNSEENGATANGVTCSDNTGQQWTYDTSEKKWKNGNGLCLALSDNKSGSKVFGWSCDGSNEDQAQRWSYGTKTPIGILFGKPTEKI